VAVHSGPGAVVTAPETGAGKPKKPRKRRYQVEIDGEVLEVSSLQEAQDVLEKVKEEAEATARVAVERAAKAKKRDDHSVRKDARRTLIPPEVESRSFPNLAKEINAEIERTYQSAINTIEIALLLRKADQEDEDDVEILLLL
jgi:hypothetical protein